MDALQEKASDKQRIYRLTQQVFKEFKLSLKAIRSDLKKEVSKTSSDIEIAYTDRGKFEAEIKFGGDVLIFTMHTNIFTFDNNHFIHSSEYVNKDPSRLDSRPLVGRGWRYTQDDR